MKLARSVIRGEGIFLCVFHPTASCLSGEFKAQLLDLGVADLIDLSACTDPWTRVLGRLERWNRVTDILDSPMVTDNLVGVSLAWRRTLRQCVEAALYSTDTILLIGETGTGKELLARLIHSVDERCGSGILVVVDCGALVPELSGSEFFGHKRGAFTGAVSSRTGVFAQADGGSLFLDEVGELPLGLQVQLLRVVQEGTYKPVGGSRWAKTNFRLICATHRELKNGIRDGTFREDLYHRLSTWVIRVPGLRERVEDIPALFGHFLATLMDLPEAPTLDGQLVEILLDRRFPGNTRELLQLARRVAARHVGPGPVSMADLPLPDRTFSLRPHMEVSAMDLAVSHALATGSGLKAIGRLAEDTAIRQTLTRTQGNIRKAAGLLGVVERTLQLRLASRRKGNGAVPEISRNRMPEPSG